MEAKEFLRQYQEALTDIRNLEAEAEEIESLAMSITASTDGERVQSSGRKDRMADLAAKAADLELEIMDMRTDALHKLQAVEKTIGKVNNKEYRQILHRKYIESNTWERIAVEMNYTYRWITRLHGKALVEVQEILDSQKSS